MKCNSVFVSFGFALMILVAYGCDSSTEDTHVSNTNFVASAEFSHTIDAAHHSTVQVYGINGTVTIRANANGGSVLIAGERRVRSESLADARDFLRRLTVTVTESGDEIIARTDQPSNPEGRECIVDYEVTIPAGMEIDVDHINGAVVLEDIKSSTYVDLTNGTLAADVDLPVDGTIDMTIINGTMLLEIPTTTSASVAASVTNGELHVSNLDFVDQQSTSQSISATLGRGDGIIRLTVVNGTLLLRGGGS